MSRVGRVGIGAMRKNRPISNFDVSRRLMSLLLKAQIVRITERILCFFCLL
jgi:hypothetical protein